MSNKLMRKIKRTLKNGRAKSMILVEMADDFMDIIQNAKTYKRINKQRKKLK